MFTAWRDIFSCHYHHHFGRPVSPLLTSLETPRPDPDPDPDPFPPSSTPQPFASIYTHESSSAPLAPLLRNKLQHAQHLFPAPRLPHPHLRYRL
ncbi:hypothetical protein K432DRAFT_377331 [Lepidopterella palustris CBS 459.81]|uniref:Uncharacterized protein n=1 Tax=Lepidopterella palustris CBS 459.81 TaxID=1314670 RepID=A0A8E2JKY7_9PEZI|nr:hypothetical protein K432DRAFT_377331 [Lepidopterella palustris CBS 459.81]